MLLSLESSGFSRPAIQKISRGCSTEETGKLTKRHSRGKLVSQSQMTTASAAKRFKPQHEQKGEISIHMAQK